MKRNCNICQNEYEAEARYINRGQGLTCSLSCGVILAQNVRAVNRGPQIPNTQCSWCGIDFYRKPSSKKSKSGHYYCSVEHQDSGARARQYTTGPEATGPTFKDCSHCGEPLTHRSSRIGVMHMKCRSASTINQWLSGDNSVTLNRSRKTGLPRDTKGFVKRYLLGVRGDRCEECGFDQHGPHGSIIQMDHINGNCFDNHPENLKLLCPNCHAMTETYGSRNKGSGRSHRRKLV